MSEKDYFVGIYDPLDVRRNLLESSKEIIKSLQSYERLEKIREEKLRLYREMKRLSAELDLLVSKIKQNLPTSGLRRTLKSKQKSFSSLNVSPGGKKFSSELQKLEEQLREVEKQLSFMT